MRHIIIVGAGQAGLACASKLRNVGFDGAITMIGAENTPPYQRPPLSKKYLLGEIALERLFLRPQRYYDENNIRLLLNTRAEYIDTANKTVKAGDSQLRYDDLVLTTGSAPRQLDASVGGALTDVHSIRSLAEIDRLAPYIRDCARALIIGGGYIGLEVAAVAAAKGMKVTLIERSDSILQRVAASETAHYFRELHKGHGVDIREGVGLETLARDGRVSRARLTDGSALDVDCVIVGIGVDPETDLAKNAGLDIENGIRTDEYGRTSDESIWAAGDCASFPFKGKRVRLESVPNAIEQAEVVAENIMGSQKVYHAKPWFWSDQFDVKLQIAGLNAGYTHVATRTGSRKAFSLWYFCEDTFVAVDAINAPREFNVGKRLLEAGISPRADEISNPDVNIMDLIRSTERTPV